MPLRRCTVTGLIALLLAPWLPVAAQSPSSPWEPHVLIARTTASVRFDPAGFSNRDRLGITPTIGVSRFVAGHGVRVELSVVRKGFERTQPTWKWTYLELPVLLELRSTSPTASFVPVAQIGIAPSLALSCRVTYVGVNGQYSGGCRERDPLGLISPASMVDLGLVFGLGLRIRSGRRQLLFELRHTRGLTTVERQSQHRVYSAGLGITFP